MQYAEIYLNLSSVGISGDAEAVDFVGQIELVDWAWGMSLEEAASKDAAGSTKQAVGKGISIKKPVDGATTGMLGYLESGKRIPTATMILVQRTQKSLMVRMDLKGVLLMSYDLEVDSDDDEVVLSEVWTFNYDEVSIQYRGRSGAPGTTSGSGTQKFTLMNSRSVTMEAASLEDKPEMGVQRFEAVKNESAGLDKDAVLKLIDEYVKKNKIGRG